MRTLGCFALLVAMGCGGVVDGNHSDGVVVQADSDECAAGKVYVPGAKRLKSSKEDPWRGRKGVVIIKESHDKSPDGRPRYHLYGIDPEKREFVWFMLDATLEDYKILLSYPESADPCEGHSSNPGGGKGESDPDPARGGGICAPESLLGDADQCNGCVPKLCDTESTMCPGEYDDGCGGKITCLDCWQ